MAAVPASKHLRCDAGQRIQSTTAGDCRGLSALGAFPCGFCMMQVRNNFSSWALRLMTEGSLPWGCATGCATHATRCQSSQAGSCLKLRGQGSYGLRLRCGGTEPWFGEPAEAMNSPHDWQIFCQISFFAAAAALRSAAASAS